MDLNAIITVLIVGGLFLLSFLNLQNVTGVNQKANAYFGLFVLIWATFWLDEMVIPRSLQEGGLTVAAIRFIQFLAPLTFYLSVVFYTNPRYRYTKRDVRYLIAPSVFLTVLLCRCFMEREAFNLLYLILVLGHALLYTTLAYFGIRHHQKHIEQFVSTKGPVSLNWIRYIIYAFIGSSVVVLLYNIITPLASLNGYINAYFLAVVYFVAFNSIRQREIYPKELNERTITAVANPDPVQKSKLMNEEELRLAKKRLLLMMETESPYLDSELTLPKLADKLGISSHQLSYLINTGLGETFYHFINRYRVRKAQELLANTEYDHLNMLMIGYESGFNSKTSFNTTFKKMTAYTPTAYRKKRPRS